MDELNLIQLEGEDSALGLIDFSSENDSLVLDDESSTQRHDPLSENWKDSQSIGLFDSMDDIKDAEAEAVTFESIDQIILSPDRVRKGKYNMRKSLAWDSAFFTSAGVLDPEELSGIIGEATKSAGNQVLPRITEDVVRSTDSVSSLVSESLTTDHVEAKLCEDIRASTQKSSMKLISLGYKEASKKSLTLPSSRKMGLATQNQVKQKPAMKKPDVMSKAIPKQNLRTQSPVRTVKLNSALSEVTKSIKVTDSTTKLPGIIGNGRSIMVKKDSFSATQVNKNEIDKLRINNGASKGAQDTKIFSINGARRILPKSTLSVKSSLVSSSKLKTGLTDSSVNSNAIARRKVSEKQLKPPSGSTLKTPIKPTTINQRSSFALSTYLRSSKNSGSVSPASSISEWSSVSSTSSSTINGMFNNSRTSFDASSCQSLDNESFASDLDHTLEGTDSSTQKTKIPSNRSGPLFHPASAKPSGLRMPSPTIGFFNGVKSVQTPNGAAQPHSRSVLCRQAKQINNTKAKIVKNLNTIQTSQIVAPDVISHDSDDGPTESNGSEINIDVIDSDLNASNREHKESLMIYNKEEIVAKDGENEIEPVGNIDQIQKAR